eukprot:TRINITY_DN6008_c0_g1_i3.p1 TRINITY_DN6008_c0_g1~~TRINITY_DN6008_c0_g1_i3.p1  ORF type:complete len:625 (+),score=171.49 TRINITY_DN6008_c0_g1_i3:24-1877(+)
MLEYDSVVTIAAIEYPLRLTIDHIGQRLICTTGSENCIWSVPLGGQGASCLNQVREKGFKDGPLSIALFNEPRGVCVDHEGNIFVSELQSHKIRKISKDGIVSTLAGSTKGFEDGVGVNAKFNGPSGLCVDLEGNIIVCDFRNHKIRKIRKDGTVSTLAGSTQGYQDGPSLNALFNGPTGVCVDLEGNLIVSDYCNYKIRKISTKDNIVSTVCGTTKGFRDGDVKVAMFDSLCGICVNVEGNIIVRDSHRIRKIKGGIVSTIAGSSSGYQDGKIDEAKFNFPIDVCLGSDGSIYISDRDNGKIRKMILNERSQAYFEKRTKQVNDSNELLRSQILNEIKSMEMRIIDEVEVRMKQQIKLSLDNILHNSPQKPTDAHQLDRGLQNRQTLSISESVNFISKLRLKNSKSLQEELNLLKKNPNFNNLEFILNEIDIWYDGWKYEDNPFNLIEDEAKAIALYTHDCFGSKEDNFYFQLNNSLRKRELNEMKSLEGYLYFLYKALDKLPNYATTIYRGIPNELKSKIEKEYKLGRPIHWSGFSSGTENIQVAKEFAGEKGIIFKIKVQNGKSIEHCSILPKEKEILLSPHIQFKVVEPIKEAEDGYFFVVLEEQQLLPPLIF